MKLKCQRKVTAVSLEVKVKCTLYAGELSLGQCMS